MAKTTRVEQLRRRLENHPVIAVLIFIGIVIIGIGSLTDAVEKISSLGLRLLTRKGKLELVSIDVPVKKSWDPCDVEDNLQHYPRVDVKVRNTSNEIAYIKFVKATVKQMYRIEPVDCFGPKGRFERTANYNLYFSEITNTPVSVESSVSQAVKGNDVDFFSFTLSLPWSYVYELEFLLQYDEDNKQIGSGPVVLAATSGRYCFCFCDAERARVALEEIRQTGDDFLHLRERLKLNKDAVEKFASLNATRSTYFDQLKTCIQRDATIFQVK
jgi:hypothetical protein